MKHLRKRRLRILPDRLFHKLWSDACSLNKKDFYIKYINTNYPESTLKKQRIKMDYWIYLVDHVWQSANMSLNEILEKQGLKKSEFSHIFCVPIRTVESWCVEPHRIAPYMKLAILRYFNMLDLGRYIRLQSEDKYEVPKHIQEDIEEDPEEWLKKELAKRKYKTKNSDAYKRIEKAEYARESIIEQTAYLDKFLKN